MAEEEFTMAGKPRTRVAKWWGLVVIIILVAGG